MPTVSGGNELLARLTAEPTLQRLGFEIELTGIRTVMVSRCGHCRGVWLRHMGAYHWIPAGYSVPQHRVASVADALAYTVGTVCANDLGDPDDDMMAGPAGEELPILGDDYAPTARAFTG